MTKKIALAAFILTLSILSYKISATPVSLPIVVTSGWKMQAAPRVSGTGAEIASAGFNTSTWYTATVPGTVLTTLVNNKVYPEPLYGENNRPDRIPDSLCRQSYWYRTVVSVPQNYGGKKIWLNFDGINYSAQVWVNGKPAGQIKGAFARGIFDISTLVAAGKSAVIAVLISPQPNPGVPHEHTIASGMGLNGGITAIDGPTFLCSLGWDWIPAIRDRNTGIWRKVFLSATGPAVIREPLITTKLNLPDTTHAAISVQAVLSNVSAKPVKGILRGKIGPVSFQKVISLAAGESKSYSFSPTSYPQLDIKHPALWWPNGYGQQNRYTLQLNLEENGKISDSQTITFGIRDISYHVSDSENLTISVNGVRVFCKGGNWGMDEAMKRIPRERLEAQIRMHKLANYTMIRNWVGQSTSEDFYDLCDKYGLLLWDEFFQPNPLDGPNPSDLSTYVANVREKIVRFRNHPSIAVWCARNEGYPPKEIDSALRKLMAGLEPVRLYQPSSTEGRGVNSGGPYYWRKPQEYYVYKEAFKTETGSVSIPTLESVKGMMPQKDWETINDDWAEHDLAKGAQHGDSYPKELADRYGKIINLADFVRKGQLANYEAYRAMYEGRIARLFNPSTGVLTWMSNPAQPSFVWQLYHHDLEPNASLFATRKACEPIHIQFNEKEGNIQLINNLPAALVNCKATITIYNLDGSSPYNKVIPVAEARPSATTDLETLSLPTGLSSVYFIKLVLTGSKGQHLSDNFYWHAAAAHPDDLKDLSLLHTMTIEAGALQRKQNGKYLLDVTLHNQGNEVALMTHLQLRRNTSDKRVLPVYYSDNYLSLVPGETKTVTIEAAEKDLAGEKPLIAVDGWNINVKGDRASTVPVRLNSDAIPGNSKETGLGL